LNLRCEDLQIKLYEKEKELANTREEHKNSVMKFEDIIKELKQRIKNYQDDNYRKKTIL